MEVPLSKYKRKIIVINPKFQLKISLIVAIIILLSSIIYPISIYETFSILTQKFGLSEQLLDTRNQLVTILIIIQIIITLIAFITFLFLSHRIAGPIYKLHKTMVEFNEGLPPQRVFFRKGDNFKELAIEYNKMIEKITNGNLEDSNFHDFE